MDSLIITLPTLKNANQKICFHDIGQTDSVSMPHIEGMASQETM